MALEIVLTMEDQDKVRQEIQALKLALISADPTQYVPQFYPEITTRPSVTNVDNLMETINAEETPMIEYDLVPPSSQEAADIIEALLADKTVVMREP